MKPYVVQHGDYLTAIAWRLRVKPEDIWDHPMNQALRDRRKNPSILCPGDVLFVPDAPPAPLGIDAAQENTYVADIPTTKVHFSFRSDGEELRDAACEIHGLGDPFPASTKNDGTLEIDLPVLAKAFEIFFPDLGLVYPVEVGGLDPIEVQSGVDARLTNLGYVIDSDPLGGAPLGEEEARRLAVSTFKVDHMDKSDGGLDPETRAALIDAHGC